MLAGSIASSPPGEFLGKQGKAKALATSTLGVLGTCAGLTWRNAVAPAPCVLVAPLSDWAVVHFDVLKEQVFFGFCFFLLTGTLGYLTL